MTEHGSPAASGVPEGRVNEHGRSRTMRRLALVVFVAAFAAAVVALRSAFADAGSEIANANWWLVAVAFLVLVAGRGGFALLSWLAAGRVMTGADLSLLAAVWMRAAAGKYLPGLVWQPLGLVAALRGSGVPAVYATSALAVDASATIVSGMVVGLAAVPALAADRGSGALWLVLVIPVLAPLHPAVFRRVVQLAERFVGAEEEIPVPSWSLVGRVFMFNGIGWALAGVSTGLVLMALDAPASLDVAVPATALSWVAGFLLLIVPAGIGVREAAFVGLLTPTVGAEVALAAALVSRALFVALDVVGAAVGSALLRRSEGTADAR